MNLTIGETLRGQTGTYTIQELVSYSDRSKSYSCVGGRGHKLRVKVYDGMNTMRGSVREKYVGLPSAEGIMSVYDRGLVGDYAFDVFEQMQGDISGKAVPLSELVSWLVEPINNGIHSLHENGILVRDITHKNLLYSNESRTCQLAGFGNITTISDVASATHKKSYPSDPRFEAQEVSTYGYSHASDYYAFGVTLYAYLVGPARFESVSENEWSRWKVEGIFSQEEKERLQNASFTALTQKEKIEYLIMGLTLPDPEERWMYSEVRAWCNKQGIPLVQSADRQFYDLAVPITINHHNCWNYKQLASCLRSDRWSRYDYSALQNMATHISRWDPVMSGKLQSALDGNPSAAGALFRWVYILDPFTDGLWWDGCQYTTGEDLSEKGKEDLGGIEIIADLLRNRCISFWLENTDNKESDMVLSVIKSLESAELSAPNSGAYRFVQVFCRQRTFRHDDAVFDSVKGVLSIFSENNPLTSRIADELFYNPSFEAWVWVNGYDKVHGTIKAHLEKREIDSITAFLTLCERMLSLQDKIIARQAYLKYSRFAPVYWLQNNIKHYAFSGEGIQRRVEFVTNVVTEALSIGQMQTEMPNQLRLYQEIVRSSKDCGDVRALQPGYSFSEAWNDIEVSPAFLKSIGA